METWINSIEFSRIEIDEPETVKLEGGFDSFERIDIRESDEGEPDTHVFKIEKETDIFEIVIHWAVEPEDQGMADEKLKELAKNRIRTESSYQASHYLKSMDLPPLQGLFAEEMIVELVPGPDESDDS